MAPLVLAVLVAGCAAKSTIPRYVHAPTSPSQVLREDDGLRLTVDPFFDRERTVQYFDVDPFDRGVVIIFVRVENTRRGDATSYLLRKEDVKLAVGNTSVSDTQVGGSTAAAEAVGVAGAAMLAPPLMIIGAGMMTHETRVQHNFAINELRSQMVSPGGSAEGFMYYRVTREEIGAQGLVMTIPIVNTATRATRTYTFVLRR